MKHLISLLLIGGILLSPLSTLAQEAGPFPIGHPLDLSPKDIPTAPLYRYGELPETPAVQEARRIMDEIIANRGLDNYLADTNGWEQFRAQVLRAEIALSGCNRENFERAMDSLYAAHRRLWLREHRIRAVLQELKTEMASYKAQFDALTPKKTGVEAAETSLFGSPAPQPFGGRLGRVEVAFETLSLGYGWNKYTDAMKWLSDSTARKITTMPSVSNSRFPIRGLFPNARAAAKFRAGGAAIAWGSTALSLYDLGAVSAEAQMMWDVSYELYEVMELVAYLRGILPQYERLGDAQSRLLGELSGLYHDHACRFCEIGEITTPPGADVRFNPPPGKINIVRADGRPPARNLPKGGIRVTPADGTPSASAQQFPFDLSPEAQAREERLRQQFRARLRQQLDRQSAQRQPESCPVR